MVICSFDASLVWHTSRWRIACLAHCPFGALLLWRNVMQPHCTFGALFSLHYSFGFFGLHFKSKCSLCLALCFERPSALCCALALRYAFASRSCTALLPVPALAAHFCVTLLGQLSGCSFCVKLLVMPLRRAFGLPLDIALLSRAYVDDMGR
jgi:hypothetical protein